MHMNIETLFKGRGKTSTAYQYNLYEGEELSFASIVDFQGLKLSLVSCFFSTCKFKNGTFQELQTEGLHFSDCEFENIVFSEINFYWLGFFNCTFKGCKFTSIDFRGASFDTVVFQDCEFESTQFIQSNLGGVCYFEDSQFNNCKFRKVLLEIRKGQSGEISNNLRKADVKIV